MNTTIKAMLRRGIDSTKAEELQAKGYTVSKLRAMTEGDLASIGLDKLVIEALLDAERPPIPEEILHRLLFECRSICCRCRNPNKGVIVHHLVPWHKSKSHDESNLIVLCPDCHDIAHTTKELTRNVTVKELRDFKERWLKRVKQLDAENVLKPMNFSVSPFWDYFNHARLLELAVELGFRSRNSRLAPQTGHNAQYVYSGRATWSDPTYHDNKELVEVICKRKGLADIRSIWTTPQMKAILQPGALIAMTGNFRFKGKNGQHGPDQIRTGHLQKHGIRLEFTFDAWEATSVSAWSGHLRGQNLCTAICFVRSVQPEGDILKVSASVLAIGNGMGGDDDGTLPDDLSDPPNWEEEGA